MFGHFKSCFMAHVCVFLSFCFSIFHGFTGCLWLLIVYGRLKLIENIGIELCYPAKEVRTPDHFHYTEISSPSPFSSPHFPLQQLSYLILQRVRRRWRRRWAPRPTTPPPPASTTLTSAASPAETSAPTDTMESPVSPVSGPQLWRSFVKQIYYLLLFVWLFSNALTFLCLCLFLSLNFCWFCYLGPLLCLFIMWVTLFACLFVFTYV